jgi:hypothetical protein
VDTEQFLARVLPSAGNFLAINWKKPADNFMGSRFFQREDVRSAARWLGWLSDKGNDAYFGTASYRDAHIEKKGNFGEDVFKGERSQANASHLKGFWIDADVQRPGEKTKLDCYADRLSAVTWLAGFLHSSGLPPPNLRVDSGYGYHWYWLLEDPLTRDEWQPYADGLAAAMQAAGFKSSAGITSDAARILRPPGTLNYKLGASVPVRVMDGTRSDYPNALVLDKLKPYVSATPPALAQAPSLTGLAGSPAAAFAGVAAPNMSAAAQTHTSQARPRYFAKIAEKCEQVKKSLAEHGKDDSRTLWRLGHVTLAGFCEDGADLVHDIGSGHAGYSAAGTDSMVAEAAAEHAQKDNGPPTCAFYDRERPGVCLTCAYFKDEKVSTPWHLGVEDEPEPKPNSASVGDLPGKYMRGTDGIRQFVTRPDGSHEYVTFLKGDVSNATLDKTPKGYLLTFTYELAGRRFPVRVYEAEIPHDIKGAQASLVTQHVSVERLKAAMIGDFLQAWITHIREQHRERTEAIQPFGYAVDRAGDHIGVAVGGTLYRSDGTTEAAPGADPRIVDGYTPHGVYEKWREAYDLVCTGRVDLQLIVAAAFGAPLMHFTGHKGLVISAWSESGTGKSSAIRVGQTVWSAPRFMSSLDDTSNAVGNKIGTVQCMPCYWDEMRVNKDNVTAMVELLFNIAQGKGKARLDANINQREVKEWETLVLVASNAPLMDHVISRASANSAGAVRLFEYNITRQSPSESALASRVINQVDTHYGHAGRTYIEYLATHYKEVDKLVIDMCRLLEKVCGVASAERMYISGMACLLVGAKLAMQLGIAKFDLKELYTLLVETFKLSRLDRRTDLTVTAGGMVAAAQVLSRFNSDYMGNRLYTVRFPRQGPAKKEPPIQGPLSQGRVEIEIARDDLVMRINRTTFSNWCRRQGLNAKDVLRQMELQLRAVICDGNIGGGTIYSTGRMHVIDVPINTPDMEEYLLVENQASTTVVLATPPAKP